MARRRPSPRPREITPVSNAAAPRREARSFAWHLLLAAGMGLFVLQLVEERRSASVPTVVASTRVWSGHIETAPRWVTPPEGHVRLTLCSEFNGSVWTPTQSASDALLHAAFGDEARAEVLQTRRCVSDGCTQQLSGAALRGISRRARATLSLTLGGWSQNIFYAMPMHRPEGQPRFHETPGLDEGAREILRGISWDDAGGESVSTPRAVCDAEADDASRLAALRALWTVPSLDLSLRVDHEDELDGVARYWSWGRDEAEVLRTLRAAWSAGRGAVPLQSLLPTRVARRIYRYAVDAHDTHNCLNAVICEDDACPALLDGEEAETLLNRSFERVGAVDLLRAGDAVIWRDESGNLVHGAAWLANRMLFTKNGVSFLRPWHIASFDAIQRSYRHGSRVEYWRRRGVVAAR